MTKKLSEDAEKAFGSFIKKTAVKPKNFGKDIYDNSDESDDSDISDDTDEESTKDDIGSDKTPQEISEKDVPEIEFRYVTLSTHPLRGKHIWVKSSDGITYTMSVHTMRNFKESGKMIVPTINEPVLPHPIEPNLVIYAKDFEDGFVLDDVTNEIKYWKIKCKKTGIYIVMENS